MSVYDTGMDEPDDKPAGTLIEMPSLSWYGTPMMMTRRLPVVNPADLAEPWICLMCGGTAARLLPEGWECLTCGDREEFA